MGYLGLDIDLDFNIDICWLKSEFQTQARLNENKSKFFRAYAKKITLQYPTMSPFNVSILLSVTGLPGDISAKHCRN